MNHFEYRNGEIFAEDVLVKRNREKWARHYCQYSLATLKRHGILIRLLLKFHIVCFSVKPIPT